MDGNGGNTDDLETLRERIRYNLALLIVTAEERWRDELEALEQDAQDIVRDILVERLEKIEEMEKAGNVVELHAGKRRRKLP